MNIFIFQPSRAVMHLWQQRHPMEIAAILFVTVAVLLLAGLYMWRLMDYRSDARERERLLAQRLETPGLFSGRMVADLPEPARRFFEFTITEGTPLNTVAEISMRGQFALGSKDAPNDIPMIAEQVLAAPEGFVWEMSGGSGLMRISGSDSASWTRFWLAGVVPVARAGGTDDHTLSAFGRCVCEAVFWTPAAVLPSEKAVWESVDQSTARVILTHKSISQSADVTVDADGRPVEIVMQRWSNANADKDYRFQPFGGYLSEFRNFSGFQLPTHVEAGNLFGTDDYFPFFIADVNDIRFDR